MKLKMLHFEKVLANMSVKDTIKNAVQSAILSHGWPECNFVVDYPTDKNASADYFSNVAMVYAKKVEGSPRDIAQKIVETLADSIDLVEKIEVAGPGFINFTLKRSYFKNILETALKAGDTWGKNDIWAGKKVIVEYTDPNPFKEFHIGHLFTNAVGESIARLFMFNGADTKRVNYQGDVGMHVACAIWGLLQDNETLSRMQRGDSYEPSQLGLAYKEGASAYKGGDESVVKEIKRINKAVYDRTDERINQIYDNGRTSSLNYFEGIYQKVGTQFDEYFFESEAGPKGKELILANPDVFPESNGARVFLGDEHGLHTRVFLNAEGLPTYEAKELALAKMKEDRLGEYDHSVISTSNEITEYFKVLRKAMSFVYPELAAKTEHIGHGTVRLTSGKMSSRTGDVITAIGFIGDVAESAQKRINENGHDASEELAFDIAIAAIKYATLKGNVLQDTVFDKEKALSFEGDSGPYLQYTHARIHSVLEKAEQAGIVASTIKSPDTVYSVERLLERFPSVVEKALLERAPHQVTGYLTELAGEFNSFYAAERIADVSDEFASYKAALSAAVALTLRQGLWILAIKAPEKM
jgi:arginyl-tRNA synthetase